MLLGVDPTPPNAGDTAAAFLAQFASKLTSVGVALASNLWVLFAFTMSIGLAILGAVLSRFRLVAVRSLGGDTYGLSRRGSEGDANRRNYEEDLWDVADRNDVGVKFSPSGRMYLDFSQTGASPAQIAAARAEARELREEWGVA